MSTKDYFKFFTSTTLTGDNNRAYLMTVTRAIDSEQLKSALGNTVTYFNQYGDGFQFTSPFTFTIDQLNTIVTEQTDLQPTEFTIINRAGLHGIGNILA
ncbi:hypothetical protein KNP65_02105 [Latilactobacillus curvatus]|uniref:hypothetical protein n=1 Tax=Latilactobacillus curvatus TaxID=28038 RepID=UPI002410F4CD|nr:hypothetical protein [Latilactobacillus curvatus]MDG2978731.1 hypothetical protein [Latilactobacillus curvatus]